MNKKKIEEFVIPVLNYVGLIGAIIMVFAYIATIIVLIIGFETKTEVFNTLLFALINAAIGLIIMVLLKIQGIAFAKNLDCNVPILTQYYNTKTKDKKLHSIKFYWLTSTIKDILIKAIGIIFSTIAIINLVIQGSNDWTLMLLALVNLLMFICFGFLALVNAYDYFNEKHIPYIINELDKMKQEEDKLEYELETIYESVNKFLEQNKSIDKPITDIPDISSQKL